MNYQFLAGDRRPEPPHSGYFPVLLLDGPGGDHVSRSYVPDQEALRGIGFERAMAERLREVQRLGLFPMSAVEYHPEARAVDESRARLWGMADRLSEAYRFGLQPRIGGLDPGPGGRVRGGVDLRSDNLNLRSDDNVGDRLEFHERRVSPVVDVPEANGEKMFDGLAQDAENGGSQLDVHPVVVGQTTSIVDSGSDRPKSKHTRRARERDRCIKWRAKLMKELAEQKALTSQDPGIRRCFKCCEIGHLRANCPYSVSHPTGETNSSDMMPLTADVQPLTSARVPCDIDASVGVQSESGEGTKLPAVHHPEVTVGERLDLVEAPNRKPQYSQTARHQYVKREPKRIKKMPVQKAPAKDVARNQNCYKCGQTGHRRLNCTHQTGERVEDGGKQALPAFNDLCYDCGKSGHKRKSCPLLKEEIKKPKKAKKSLKLIEKKKSLKRKAPDEGDAPYPAAFGRKCFRCGGNGHQIKDCATPPDAAFAGKCSRCRGSGHSAKECSFQQKRYALRGTVHLK